MATRGKTNTSHPSPPASDQQVFVLVEVDRRTAVFSGSNECLPIDVDRGTGEALRRVPMRCSATPLTGARKGAGARAVDIEAGSAPYEGTKNRISPRRRLRCHHLGSIGRPRNARTHAFGPIAPGRQCGFASSVSGTQLDRFPPGVPVRPRRTAQQDRGRETLVLRTQASLSGKSFP